MRFERIFVGVAREGAELQMGEKSEENESCNKCKSICECYLKKKMRFSSNVLKIIEKD